MKLKRKLLAKHLWLTRLVLLLGFLGVSITALMLGRFILKQAGLDKYITLAKIFVLAPMDEVESIDQKTNILLLGKGGGETTAPDLTDTIMFISINHASQKVTIISLPRDIWIPALRTKLNSVYYWGNQKSPGGGLILAKSQIEEIVGVPIHYGIVVDFSGFKEIINALGGIEVNIDRSFTDEWYPIPGKENDLCNGDQEFRCRYETITFNKGVQVMDGETALKFARSRHSEDLKEGTDLARSLRQQKILEAIKGKALSSQILLSPKKLEKLWNLTWQMIETDLPEPALAVLSRKTYDARENISSFVLPEDLLINPKPTSKYDNLYVFVPKSGNWNEIQSWVKKILTP